MKNYSLPRLPLLFALLATPAAFAQDQLPAATPAAPRSSWSPQAKDATIGGAAGLLGGLLLNGRNRKVGGLIGGLAGAGAGYVLGQHQANQRKAAAAAAAQQAAANEQAAADAQAAATQQAAQQATASQQSADAQAAAASKVQAATARAQAAHRAAEQAQAARQRAEHQLAASRRAVAAQTQGQPPAPADLAVAAGFLPNPTFGEGDTAYSFSAVLRKSW